MSIDRVTRLLGRTIRNRAMVANALCALAEEECLAGQQARVLDTISTVRQVFKDINEVLDGDVSALPMDDVRETTDLLRDLDARLDAIQKATGRKTIH